MTSRWIALLVLAVAGCDQVFGLERGKPQLEPGCSGMRMLADDFEDGTFAPNWGVYMTDPSITVTEAGGVATMQLALNGYGLLSSGHYFDLRDDAFTIEVTDDTVPGPRSGEITLSLVSEVTNFNQLWIRREGDALRLIQVVDNQILEVDRVPYDPVEHRFWRIAKVKDTTTWSASPDGATYTELASVDGLDWVTFMRVDVEARREIADPMFTAVFDTINGGTSRGTACPTFALADDFEDGSIDPKWARRSAAVVEQDGELQVSVPGGAFTDNYVQASTFHDLSQGSFVLEAAEPFVQSPDLETYLQVTTNSGSTARLFARAGELVSYKTGSVLVDRRPYDFAAHRWWRLRGDAGRLHWEVSADGVVYETLGSASDLDGLDRVDVWFGIVGGAPAPATTEHFASFNDPD